MKVPASGDPISAIRRSTRAHCFSADPRGHIASMTVRDIQRASITSARSRAAGPSAAWQEGPARFGRGCLLTAAHNMGMSCLRRNSPVLSRPESLTLWQLGRPTVIGGRLRTGRWSSEREGASGVLARFPAGGEPGRHFPAVTPGPRRTGNVGCKAPSPHPRIEGRGKLMHHHRSRILPAIHRAFVGLAAFAIIAAATQGDPAEARSRRHHRSDQASKGGYQPPYSAIVVDANSGRVLHASNADSLRHPAAITKIMTLYLLFEQLEAGKLKLDSRLPVSAHAAAQEPSKLGLEPGQTIATEDAIKAVVTKSANDIAVVIAEVIAGNEEDFAKLMTRKAHALGMTRTVYTNASGLPDDEQVTTARDQALLGRAIQDRFPRYYRYFATSSFHFHGMDIRNHNHLLGRIQGVDGIKTGYTRASGFNLVSSVRRGGRHVVAVVFGGSSSGARDARMRDLIEQHIAEASIQRTVPMIAEAIESEPARANTRVAAADPAAPGKDHHGAAARDPEFRPRFAGHAGAAGKHRATAMGRSSSGPRARCGTTSRTRRSGEHRARGHRASPGHAGERAGAAASAARRASRHSRHATGPEGFGRKRTGSRKCAGGPPGAGHPASRNVAQRVDNPTRRLCRRGGSQAAAAFRAEHGA